MKVITGHYLTNYKALDILSKLNNTLNNKEIYLVNFIKNIDEICDKKNLNKDDFIWLIIGRSVFTTSIKSLKKIQYLTQFDNEYKKIYSENYSDTVVLNSNIIYKDNIIITNDDSLDNLKTAIFYYNKDNITSYWKRLSIKKRETSVDCKIDISDDDFMDLNKILNEEKINKLNNLKLDIDFNLEEINRFEYAIKELKNNNIQKKELINKLNEELKSNDKINNFKKSIVNITKYKGYKSISINGLLIIAITNNIYIDFNHEIYDMGCYNIRIDFNNNHISIKPEDDNNFNDNNVCHPHIFSGKDNEGYMSCCFGNIDYLLKSNMKEKSIDGILNLLIPYLETYNPGSPVGGGKIENFSSRIVTDENLLMKIANKKEINYE